MTSAADRHAAFMAAVEAQRWDDARRLGLAFLADADPTVDRARLHRALGIVARRAGDPAAARAHLEQALALGADDPETLAQLGALVRPTEPERSLMFFRRAATAADPHGERQAWHHLAFARALTEDTLETETACAHFERAAESPALRAEALAYLVAGRAQLGDGVRATAAAEALAAEPSAPAHTLAHALAALADVPEATDAFWRVHARLSASPATDVALELALFAIHRRLVDGQASVAEAAARIAVAQFPDAPRARWARAEAALHVALAGAHAAAPPDAIASDLGDAPLALRRFFVASALALGAPEQAAEALAALRRAHPADTTTALLEAQIHDALGDPAGAREAFARARTRDAQLDQVGAQLEDAAARLLARALPSATLTPDGSRDDDDRIEIRHIQPTADLVELVLARPAQLSILGPADPANPAARARVAAIHAVFERLAAAPLPLALPALRLAGDAVLVATHATGQPWNPQTPFGDAHAAGLGAAHAALADALASVAAGTPELLAAWPPTPSLAALRSPEVLARALADARAPAIATARIAALHADFRAASADLPTGLVLGDFSPHALSWDGPRPTALASLVSLTDDLLARAPASAVLALVLDPSARATLPTFLANPAVPPLGTLIPLLPMLALLATLNAIQQRRTAPARAWVALGRDLDRLATLVARLPPTPNHPPTSEPR